MALRASWLKVPWRRADRRSHDPYWDFFINTPPADRANTVLEVIRQAPEGNVFPTRADLHSPEVTASHVKEMAHYLGADLVGITRLDDDDAGHPFAVVCAVRDDYDPRATPGIGGHAPVQNGQFVTTRLASYVGSAHEQDGMSGRNRRTRIYDETGVCSRPGSRPNARW